MTSIDKTVFVAGASGAVGRVLCQLLTADGWRVVGTTRSTARAAALETIGVEPAIADVFDRDALFRVVGAAKPSVVVHQLTDLPKERDAERLAAALPHNARLREVGTEHLVDATIAAGAKRLVAQSVAFNYAPGPRPYREEAPLETSATALAHLEQLVLGGPFEGIVLRYGRFYGPRTWYDQPTGEAPVHVDAAADAARRAVTVGEPGIYNIAEDDGTVSSEKAKRVLGWRSSFRMTPREEGNGE
ncbi:MAG TPA: NAD(P)-dependent oxidoreductase [Gemmatimonadaceae bacterium]